MEVILFGVVPALVLIGSFSGLLAILKLKDIQKRLHAVERAQQSSIQAKAVSTPVSTAPEEAELKAIKPRPANEAHEHESPAKQWEAPVSNRVSTESGSAVKAGIDWYALLQQYWMVLLGGISLVLAGVFLVRYSIEHGMLGPAARFGLGLLFGAGLIAGGEWLRRSERLAADVHAVLVASGILVIYSAFLVGLHVYSLVSAQFAFICMAIVSASSMLLALKHGPMTAGMGLLGAYLVPILVSTGSKNIEAALIYSLVVTAGSLWLQRYIYRSWLWWGTWIGAFGWFIISLDMPENAQGLRAVYLAALAYASAALPFAGLKLLPVDINTQKDRDVAGQLTVIYILIAIAVIILLRTEHMNELSYPAITALPIVAMLVARRNLPLLYRLPPIILLPFAIDLVSVDIRFVDWVVTIAPMAEVLQSSYVTLLISVTTASVLIGGYELSKGRNRGYWGTIALFTPLAAILLSYIRITGFTGGLEWGVPTASLGIAYGYLLDVWRRRHGAIEVEAAFAIASQVAISLACFMTFSHVTLTLVLALQLVGLALTDRKLRIHILPAIMKVLLVIILLRLTANPWIFIYDVSGEVFLLTYSGCLTACIASSLIIRGRDTLNVWLHSASAQLAVLTLAVFTRYFIYDGDIFARSFNLTEASIYVCSWCAIGLVYDWKTRNIERHRYWYQLIGRLHIGASALIYLGYSLLIHNPLWSYENVSDTPVFNLLLIGYGVPVVLFAVVYKRIQSYKRTAGLIALVGLFVFVTQEVRHIWNSGISPAMRIQEGELYTYSLVWLLLAVVILVYGAYRNNNDAQKAGMVALLMVVVKVFFWDMSDLDGLWRVVSFLGLGVSLLGVAYLFNQVRGIAGERVSDNA